jgi:hypothetical protein
VFLAVAFMHLIPEVFSNVLISKGAEMYELFMDDEENHGGESHFPLPYLLVLLG